MSVTLDENGKVVNPEGLEVNATLQCNMRCRSCAHLSPLFRRENVDPAKVHDALVVLGRHYRSGYVKIMGGEPLLHPDILGVIEAVRTSGVTDTILVATNGTLLHRAPEAFWQAVDRLELSIYPSRMLSSEQVRHYRSLARQHDVALEVNYYGHFRIAYSEQGTDSQPLVQEIFDTCKLAHTWRSHTLHDGWLYRCPQSVFVPAQLQEGGWDREVDGIRIEDGPTFRDRLYEFFTSTTPLRACRNCLGSVGKLHSHVEVPRQQWRPVGRTEDLLDFEFLEICKQDINTDDGCVVPSCPLPEEGAP
ncbi:radical SAM protein [Saccharomonospora sp. NB11]|uniref:radical SAM protein n=1 Tax=Saccharomonospora sp. NB11 TaxID=1642298 RepID=UPI0018D18C08|nr:radical SAM protein [Saccharomonospora sp. NB11]